ncbi:hypothetical protein JCM8097_007656 [Rhodosporidiobolus ruineniae]
MATAASSSPPSKPRLSPRLPPLEPPSIALPAQSVPLDRSALSGDTLADHPDPNLPKRPPPFSARLSFEGLKRSIARQPQHDGHTDDEREISHQARVLYALITGAIPPDTPKRRFLPGVAGLTPRITLPPTFSAVSLATVAEPELSDIEAKKGGRPTTARKKDPEKSYPVPHVKPKALKKLKSDLLKADKARAIVADLKKMEVPPEYASATGTPSSSRKSSRSYTLAPFPDPNAPSTPSFADSTPSATPDRKSSNPPFAALDVSNTLAVVPTTAGAVGGLAAAKTGVFEILAGTTGALVEMSGVHDDMVDTPPLDRITILIWWWGFELAVPPPAMKFLASVASVQQAFFTFLQAFIAAGGAPELAPLVRYISSYFDMEFQAIRAQNKGNGVVLAATWILPVALVPRPWDFPLPPTSPRPRPPQPPKEEKPYPGPTLPAPPSLPPPVPVV